MYLPYSSVVISLCVSVYKIYWRVQQYSGTLDFGTRLVECASGKNRHLGNRLHVCAYMLPTTPNSDPQHVSRLMGPSPHSLVPYHHLSAIFS